VAAMMEQLPVGSPVRCACPRLLVAAPIHEHIRYRPDGRIYFPPAAPHVGLRVWHRPDCSTGRAEHEHFNVGDRVEADGTLIYRCSICGLERTHIEIADEMRTRSRMRAAS
jgi:hypothetical protein